jgi:hypothetical protein
VEKPVENLVDLHAAGMVQNDNKQVTPSMKIPTSRKRREKWGTHFRCYTVVTAA